MGVIRKIKRRRLNEIDLEEYMDMLDLTSYGIKTFVVHGKYKFPHTVSKL